MRVKLHTKSKFLCVRDLKDGQLAEIVEGDYKGKVVQRVGDALISIGEGYGDSWSTIFREKVDIGSIMFKVRILESGEIITVTDNN